MIVSKMLNMGPIQGQQFNTTGGIGSVSVSPVSIPADTLIMCNTTDLTGAHHSSLSPHNVFLVAHFGPGQSEPAAKTYFFLNAPHVVGPYTTSVGPWATKRYTMEFGDAFSKLDIASGTPTLGASNGIPGNTTICVNKADILITESIDGPTYTLTANSVFLVASSEPDIDGAYFTDRDIPLKMLSDDWEEPKS